MYNIKTNEDLAINSKLLLNSDKESLEQLFIQRNVDPSSLEDMMRTIHDWYRKESHLPEGQLHDQFIARLLIMRKFSIEKVKQKIDNYYSIRPKMAEFLSKRDPMEHELNTCLKHGYWIVLPRKTAECYRVTILRMSMNKTSPDTYCEDCVRTHSLPGGGREHLYDGERIYVLPVVNAIKYGIEISALNLLKVICMMGDYRMRNDSVMGEELILDFGNATLQLAMQMTPVLISKILYYTRQCLGAKIKGVHVVNMPAFSEVILILFKKCMNPKVVKRMHFYKNFDDVLKKFPDNIFPKDLGGTDDVTCQDITDAWERTLCSNGWRNYFIEQDSIHSDESKRTIRKNIGDDFGLDGSFKRLNID